MAKNTSKAATKGSDDSNVVRIKASSTSASKKTVKAEEATIVTPVKASSKAPAEKTVAPKREKANRGIRGGNVFRPVGAYFAGAWRELRQVRWPNRRATWGLTGAVLLYSAFFVVIVLLLDALFKYLFQLILGK